MQVELSYQGLTNHIKASVKGVFIVSGKTFERAGLYERLDLEAATAKITRFSEFSENPNFEEVVRGVSIFKQSGADLIIAVGGGTAIDLAKLVKYYSDCDMTLSTDKLPMVEKVNKDIRLVAVPTTFGTGSEATHFAVLYFKGKKFSIASSDLTPNMTLIDSGFAATLPVKVKAAACLDALCQAIESLWSKNRTSESTLFARAAVNKIVRNYDSYIKNGCPESSTEIAIAANLSGKAIDITKTTAPHALSYTLTSDYLIPHGHAVALCIRNAFEVNEQNASISDQEISIVMSDVYDALGVKSSVEAKQLFINFMELAGLESSIGAFGISSEGLDVIVKNVNVERLSNHPVKLTSSDLLRMLADR